jgi:phosphatidylglycerophosphatase A
MITGDGQPTLPKESSDDLDSITSSAPQTIAPVKRARSFKDFAALAISTCGVGYLPLAPGTWGSFLAVLIYLVLRTSVSRPHGLYSPQFVATQVVLIASATAVGIWAASRTERILKIKDPGRVVIDEVAGQLIALLPVPLTADNRWPVWLMVAFLLFRFFDIVKPYPARKLESLPGGLGIMADDLVAGVYAGLLLALGLAVSSSI